MRELEFRTRHSLLVIFQTVALLLFDNNEPLLAEITTASQAGYAAFFETQCECLAGRTVEKLVAEILEH